MALEVNYKAPVIQRRGAAFLTQKLFKRKRPQSITSGAANLGRFYFRRG